MNAAVRLLLEEEEFLRVLRLKARAEAMDDRVSPSTVRAQIAEIDRELEEIRTAVELLAEDEFEPDPFTADLFEETRQ